MRFGPPGFQLQGGLKLFDSLPLIALFFQRKRQIVMCDRIVGRQFQRPAVCGNGLVPGFPAGKFDGLLAIRFGRLRKRATAVMTLKNRKTVVKLAERYDERAAGPFINIV